MCSFQVLLTLPARLMAQFIDWYNTEADLMHPFEGAAKVHTDFVGIHPYS